MIRGTVDGRHQLSEAGYSPPAGDVRGGTPADKVRGTSGTKILLAHLAGQQQQQYPGGAWRREEEEAADSVCV